MDGKTLKNWLESNRYDVGWLAEKLGITRQSVYEQLRKGIIGDVFRAKLLRAGLYIFTPDPNLAEEPLNTFKPYNAKHVELNSGRDNLTIIPLKAQGGFVTGYEHRVFLDSLERIAFPWIKGACWGFEIVGFSMYKKDDDESLKPGDLVICTELQNENWLAKGKIHVFVTVDGICCKLFDKVENGEYHLKSANDEYNPVTPIPVKEVKKIYFKEYIIKK